MTMEFGRYRPERFSIKNDEKYISLINDLFWLLKNVSVAFNYKTLRLNEDNFQKIAHLLVEFFEDLHFDIGIWKTYENFNKKIFNVALPCTIRDENEFNPEDKFSTQRIQHFLWNVYGLIEPNLVFSPQHKDLVMLSVEINHFISNAYNRFPEISTVKSFLQSPVYDGYDVKKKLIWIGTKSYFFRENFKLYLKQENLKEEIPIIDDFINQISTTWSGLNVIDLLPDLLKIPQSRKDDIKTWYERHAAFYLIKSVQRKKVNAENIINKKDYRIIIGGKTNPFEVNDLVFGNTVKYSTEWYWSGTQQRFNSYTTEQMQEIKDNFINKTSKIVYRYDKQLLEKAIKRNIELYKEFVENFGSDFIVFSNGLNFAASIQKIERIKYEKLSDEEFKKLQIKHNLKNKSPNYNIPEGLINSKNEVAVYYNIKEGQEILSEYTAVKSALNKEGKDLTDEDIEFIHALIEENSISPDFVYKILSKEHGKKSVLKAYHLKNEKDIDYLIRKYRGIYFKNRYPSLTLI